MSSRARYICIRECRFALFANLFYKSSLIRLSFAFDNLHGTEIASHSRPLKRLRFKKDGSRFHARASLDDRLESNTEPPSRCL